MLINGSGKHTEVVSNFGQYSCGDNDKGQLRSEVKDAVFELKLVQFPTLQKILKLSCGWDFTLALLETGKIFGWGSNFYGQLGCENLTSVCKPIQLLVPSAVDISCGLRHSAVVTKDGSVFSAGFNNKYQLGLETTANKSHTFLKGFTAWT